MSDLATLLRGLDARALAYVEARSTTFSRKEAIIKASVTRDWAYKDVTRLDELDAIALELQRNRVALVEPQIQNAATKALEIVLHLMENAKSEHVKLMAAQEILNRALGTPTQRVVETTSGDLTIRVVRGDN